nr:ribonuclease H-like domain-containing protein [Tanacetum cinerariifolium]
MTKCAAIGYRFLLISFSYLEELEADAVTLVKRIRKFFMAQDIGARNVVHIFNRISFVIDKEEPYLLALKRILQYVCGTLHHGLQLHASSMTQLVVYTNADSAGCPVTRRSTSGYCVFLRDNLLSSSAKQRVTLSHSSVEAEYHGVVNVVAKTAWNRNLLRELHTPLFTPTRVLCDNGKVTLVDNDVKPLKKVNYPSDHDSEYEVELVDNDMARSIASERVGFDTKSFVEQLRDSYKNGNYDEVS